MILTKNAIFIIVNMLQIVNIYFKICVKRYN